MADLSVSQLAYVRSELGVEPSDDVLNTRFDALDSVSAVILEQLRTRRAELSNGSSFSIAGFYSESIGADAMRWITDAINRITASAEAIDAGDYVEQSIGIARLVRPGWSRRGRPRYDSSRLA